MQNQATDGHCTVCGCPSYTVRYQATNGGTTTTSTAFECTTGGYGSHGRIVRCTDCDHMYTFPRLSNDELVQMYIDVEDSTYVQERKGRELTFAKHLKHLQKFTGNGASKSLLDVGAYTGLFVQTATQAGWNAVGIEPSEWCVKQAQSEGIELVQGTLDTVDFASESFDAVTMWDVIEHVDDPAALVKQATALLKPGGVLAVHTMDTTSLASRILGHRWPWYMDMHVHYFSKSGLTKLIKDAGYTVEWVGAEGRVLTLHYFANRLRAFFAPVGVVVHWFARIFKAQNVPVPVNFGDIITVYARKN